MELSTSKDLVEYKLAIDCPIHKSYPIIIGIKPFSTCHHSPFHIISKLLEETLVRCEHRNSWSTHSKLEQSLLKDSVILHLNGTLGVHWIHLSDP